MARVLVTGGAGFMGSHVVDGLVAKGHDVLVVDDLSTGTRSNLSANVEFVDLDVADDAFVSLVKSFRPDVISHSAAQASVPVSMSDPGLDARVNILGGLNVCRAAMETGCEQVLYINTGGALYGEPEDALQREVLEETGWSLANFWPIGPLHFRHTESL